MKNALVLLANGDLTRRLYFLHPRSRCPALVPVHTTTLLQNALQRELADWEVYVLVNDRYREELAFFCDRFPTANFLFLSSEGGVLDTLQEALPFLTKHPELWINPITTILDKAPLRGALFGEHKVLSNQYSGLSEAGHIVSKGSRAALEEEIRPFTGAFRAETQSIAAAITRVKNTHDMMELIKELKTQDSEFPFSVTSWLDFGHDFSFFDSRSRLLSSRSFNRIEVDSDGILRKTSQHPKKLRQEFDFLNALPNDLKVHFPRTLGAFHKKETGGQFACEFYAYPCVSELFLHWDLHPEVWRKLFQKLESILKQFADHTAGANPASLRQLFIKKNLDRHDAFLDSLAITDPAFLERVSSPLMINGKLCQPFPEIRKEWERYLSERLDSRPLTVMHGDFCFNNILFEPSVGLVKLIDPRGSLDGENSGIFGDRRYDLAKLLHSADGGYDAIVNDLFTLRETAGGFSYAFVPNPQGGIVKRLAHELVEKLGENPQEIRVHMANLFLSMPLLHEDAPARQKAMYLHGLRLLCDVFEHAQD